MLERTIILPDSQSVARFSADWLINHIREKPNSVLCISAGHTQIETLAEFCRRIRTDQVDISRIRFVGLDEWLGLDSNDDGSCHHFLRQHLFEPAGFRPGQIVSFDARNEDTPAQCRQMDQWLDDNGPIDLLMVGVGMNGHIGFNEPGTPVYKRSHLHELDALSRRVGQKYFSYPRELSHGLTLGLKDLLQSRQILVQVIGEGKAGVVKHFLQQPHKSDQPVSHFWPLPHCSMVMDQTAASLIQ